MGGKYEWKFLFKVSVFPTFMPLAAIATSKSLSFGSTVEKKSTLIMKVAVFDCGKLEKLPTTEIEAI